MPVEILIAATNLNSSKKGDICAVHDSPWTWGNKESLPRYVQLTISDATEAQTHHYLDQWTTKFDHEILNEDGSGYRVRVSVDPSVISASNVGKSQIKSRMLSWIEGNYNGQSVTFTADSMTVDIPKPVDLQEVKRAFADIFDVRFQKRKYHFSDADVDTVVGQGGTIVLTTAQALNYIKDKVGE